MKRTLTILLAILSLSILFYAEGSCKSVHSDYVANEQVVDDAGQSFSQGGNYIGLNGCQGSSSSVISSKVVTNNSASRRSALDILSGVRIAIAHLYSSRSYSLSCDFPFEHQPQRELFFILRNIRI